VTDDASGHLRPFFPSARDFEAATNGHFRFLVDEFDFSGPRTADLGQSFEVRYDGLGTAVLLNWDLEGGYFACHLAPLLSNGEIHPDPERWLSSNEILAARGALERWIGHDELESADEVAFGRTMARQAANLRDYCADVLRGDWSIFEAAHRWLEHPTDA
jgi:hypothetical protein